MPHRARRSHHVAWRQGRSRPLSASGLVVIALMAVVTAMARPAGAATGDIGYEGPSYQGAYNSPSGSKVEHKLWWNDGSWWASMFDPVSADYHIFKLEAATQSWRDTGVALDPRPGSRADTLWDGTHLYVASHLYSTTPAAGYPTYLYRFGYDASTDAYRLDAGFPVTINNWKSETLSLAKDSTGKLWATWVADGKVWVNATTGGDATWGTPFVLPVTGSAGSADEISGIVAFGGNKVGVMWSNQVDWAMYFSIHVDGQADTAWQPSTAALNGTYNADDHISLKADSTGRVFAAVKTDQTAPTAPLTMLLVRDPVTGTWARHTFGLVSDSHTRPVVVLDEERGLVRVFATGPHPPNTSGQASGDIYEKASPMNAIAFAPGLGTPVIRDADSDGMNNVTSGRQSVTSASGLVVMATNSKTLRSWHHHAALAPPVPVAPTASFTGSPTSGPAPLTVQFTDTSTGTPTAWSWSFGDGTTSSAQHPSHRYSAAGTYTVSLTASNAGGSSTATRSGYVSVAPPPSAASFAPVADADVRDLSPDTNYGKGTILRVRKGVPGDSSYRSYLKFTVSGAGGRAVTSAKLRLYVTDGSTDGGSVNSVASTWGETTITWRNAPAVQGTPVAQVGPATMGTWVDVTLPAGVITGDGTYSLAISGNVSNTFISSSREGSSPPQLVVSFG